MESHKEQLPEKTSLKIFRPRKLVAVPPVVLRWSLLRSVFAASVSEPKSDSAAPLLWPLRCGEASAALPSPSPPFPVRLLLRHIRHSRSAAPWGRVVH